MRCDHYILKPMCRVFQELFTYLWSSISQEEWRRTNFGTSRPENKTSCSWLWNTFDYLGFSIVNDTSRPIETKLVGVNMGENMEQILKICVQRIQEKWEKWLIPRWIKTICKNSAFVIRYYAIIFDCSYHC